MCTATVAQDLAGLSRPGVEGMASRSTSSDEGLADLTCDICGLHCARVGHLVDHRGNKSCMQRFLRSINVGFDQKNVPRTIERKAMPFVRRLQYNVRDSKRVQEMGTECVPY